MTFLEAAWIVGQIPDDPNRVRSNDSLDDCDDENYEISTEIPDIAFYNDFEAEELGL